MVYIKKKKQFVIVEKLCSYSLSLLFFFFCFFTMPLCSQVMQYHRAAANLE